MKVHSLSVLQQKHFVPLKQNGLKPVFHYPNDRCIVVLGGKPDEKSAHRQNLRWGKIIVGCYQR